MVLYTELTQLGILIVGIISLFIQANMKKTSRPFNSVV